MYDKNDPRSGLQPARSSKLSTGLIAEEQFATFYDTPPQVSDGNGNSWFVRGHNFVVAFTEGKVGGTFSRTGQSDEYALLLPKEGAIVEAGGERSEVPGYSIVFVPPGDSVVSLPEGGRVIRLFTTAASDMVELCPNADAYDTPRSHIPQFEAWPAPEGGFRIRHYSLDVPKESGRFGRIFRCTTFMVNMLDGYDGPRDPSRLSPHHHGDFEQCSLLLEGEYDHHLRWPWTTDMADWKADQTLQVGAPSVLVIPPPTIHTSRATGSGRNQLVDIFCPPRIDFSDRPGWVLNADDYPIPDIGRSTDLL